MVSFGERLSFLLDIAGVGCYPVDIPHYSPLSDTHVCLGKAIVGRSNDRTPNARPQRLSLGSMRLPANGPSPCLFDVLDGCMGKHCLIRRSSRYSHRSGGGGTIPKISSATSPSCESNSRVFPLKPPDLARRNMERSMLRMSMREANNDKEAYRPRLLQPRWSLLTYRFFRRRPNALP